MSKNQINDIRTLYENIRTGIITRLESFRTEYMKMNNDDLFAELSFCTLTPQSKAVSCWKCIETLRDRNLLMNGCEEELRSNIKGVRFHNNKSKYIVHNRELTGRMDLKEFINDNSGDIFKLRKWLVKNIKGYSYKEASHFLRNIGLGSGVAILDRHILKNLVLLGVINEIPKTISEKIYLEIEQKMISFSEEIRIPMDHLDILFWYRQTGCIFK
jgi:N-glycosylase/DNA lyase